MNRIEDEYKVAMEPIERLYESPTNIKNKDAKDYFELNLLADLVVDYEETYYPL